MTITYTVINTYKGVPYTTQYVPIKGTGNYLVQAVSEDGKMATYVATLTFSEVEGLITHFRSQEDVQVTGELIEEKLDAVGNVTS